MLGGMRIAATAAALAMTCTAALGAELKIGAVGSLSGGGTDWGVATQRGVQLAIDEVLAAGGLKVGTQTFEPKMIMYDDQYTGQGGTTAATRLVNVDGVSFILGPIGSPPVLGVLGVTQPKKVIVLSNGFSPKILSAEATHNFRVSITTKEFAPPIVKWLKAKHPTAKTVGIISPNDAVGQSVIPILVDAYKSEGFTVAFDEKYERGMKDFAPILTRIMATGVDILDLDSNAPGETGLMLRQARQLGFKGLIIQSGGPGVEEVMKVAGPLAEGFLTYNIFDPEDPAAQQFVKAYAAKWSGPINAYCPIMYNAARVLFEAMRRAASTDVDKVRDAIEGLQGYDTIFGKVNWGGKANYGINHQLLIDFYISEVKNGKLTTVARVKSQ